MSIIKQRIKLNDDSVTIKFPIGNSNMFVGEKQTIDRLAKSLSDELVNPVSDLEVKRFKSVSGKTISFYFYNTYWYYNPNTYMATFLANGFTGDEFIVNEKNVENSFFVLDFFDSSNISNQEKIFSTYLTKLTKNTISLGISSYTLDDTCQFYYSYIPNDFLKKQTGDTITGYTRFYFYNAKFGFIVVFYNEENESLITPEKMFFETEINLIEKTWNILPSISTIKAKEVINNSEYIEKIKNTVTNFDNYKQNYPEGEEFDYETGTYRKT